MGPMVNAMVSRVRPKAKATPRKPMPKWPAPGSPAGKAAASTALPHPPNTSQKVPKNSAVARLPIVIGSSLTGLERFRVSSGRAFFNAQNAGDRLSDGRGDSDADSILTPVGGCAQY